MQSFLSSQEEHWAVKPIWHGGKSTQCGKRLGMETFVIYLFICTFFFLLHFHSDSLELHHMVKKRRMKIFSIEQHFIKKKTPKIGPIFSFWNLVFSDKHGFWLTGADCSKGFSRGWKPIQSQLKVIVSLTQKGHIIHIKHKRLLTHANVLCVNLWTEQSTTTGKVPDRLPSIQQKHSFPAYIEHWTPLSTPNPTVDHFHHFSFTRGKKSRTDQPVLVTSMVNHILSQHWQDQTQLHSNDVALGSGHGHLLECPSLHLYKC